MSLNVSGTIGIVLFYIAILFVGIWAAIKKKAKAEKNDEREDCKKRIDKSEDILVAGRSLGLLVSSITMTATWVGGGYINGTSEETYKKGLLAVQAPFCYAASLALGGLIFAEKMRSKHYVTMLDPFQEKYGARIGALMYIPLFIGDILWCASILAALGASIGVVLDIDNTLAIIVSACFCVAYTFVGGLYSVAYTDIVQIFFIFVGLWLSIPFAFTNQAVHSISSTKKHWLGHWETKKTGVWIDNALLLIFGAIPSQVYFQRVLACKTAKQTKAQSLLAAFACFVMAIPPFLIGALATSTDWSATAYKGHTNSTLPKEDANRVLPLVLQYLTPPAVAFIGLGAVTAAVMSSADSAILSSSSMISRNIYKVLFRPQASEREMLLVIRITTCCVGFCATVMALNAESIYGLWAFCVELIYVVLFPQLCCVIFMANANSYGALSGYIVAVFFRAGGGVTFIGLKPFIHYPWYDKSNGQLFPFKSFAMILSSLTIIIVSSVTKYLFKSRLISTKWDVLGYFQSTYETAFEESSVEKEKSNENSHLLADILN